MFAKVARFFHTLWPLKLVQHWGLFYYRVLRRLRPFTPTQTWATQLENREVDFHRYQPLGWKGDMEFEFLNSAATVQSDRWEASGQSLLWHYNLHYFDHLNARENPHSAADEASLIGDWWQRHQPLQGVAWEPYPASLRAVNLCKWGWAHNRNFEQIGQADWLAILDRHYQEIRRKLEYHIQANHLFANLKALWFLQAALPDYRAQEGRWLRQLVQRELRVQFDADGGHFELSPMYHRIMLWDVLDMLAVGRQVADCAQLVPVLEELLPRALRWMQALSHPDSEVAFFNDGCTGIAPKQAELLAYAASLDSLALAVTNALYSGYGVARVGDATLLCDAAEVGPDFQPGHGHADSLSFELSIGNQRVIVNSGTSEYGSGPERLRQRSTAAHSTLCLAGENSSDVWSGFRVGRQARIIERSLEVDEQGFCLVASHDGYTPAIHRRRWALSAGELVIDDQVTGSGDKKSYVYFHPDILVSLLADKQILLRWDDREALLQVECEQAELSLQESTWHPAFNSSIKNIYLVIRFVAPECKITLQWSD